MYIGDVFPAVSNARNCSVVVVFAGMLIGAVYMLLDVVGVVPFKV